LKAVIPGGASAPVLTADEIDVGCDFDDLRKAGSMGGSGAVIVLDDSDCMVESAYVLARFFAHESCGQCTPCREGSGWLEKIFKRILDGGGISEDIDHLIRITQNMCGTSICPLSEGDALPMRAFVTKFRGEFEHHIREKACDVKLVAQAK
ncbi:MAG: NADH-quinone oxidoreductase subunit F, partial [Planctomycetota bacterium]|nr:NADH-quinone oxidoreductase subunit F [Planctomycetota bacterium]